METCYHFITHPNVAIDRSVPVPRWPLSELGRARMRQGLAQPWVAQIDAIFCSTEQKAVDGAQILGEHLRLPWTEIAELGENDRSATGFVPPQQFEQLADAFFARPDVSVRGWELARDAQSRIVAAVARLAELAPDARSVAIVSHGAVGTLLYCHLAGVPIDRRWDQPPNGGGNYYRFTLRPPRVAQWWQPIDAPL